MGTGSRFASERKGTMVSQTQPSDRRFSIGTGAAAGGRTGVHRRERAGAPVQARHDDRLQPGQVPLRALQGSYARTAQETFQREGLTPLPRVPTPTVICLATGSAVRSGPRP